jgi:intracellular septation protein
VSAETSPGAADQAKRPGAGARLLTDLGPLLIFFLVNFLAPVPASLKIFVATGAFMVAMMAAMLISQIRYRHISPLLWFSGVMVVIFGGLTIWLHNETFIKVKPTIYYVTVATLLLVGLKFGHNYLKLVLGSVYPGLNARGWHLLTRNWIIFFYAMAVGNEIAWRAVSTDAWVAMKLWLFMPATFLFILANVPMLMRHGLAIEEAEVEPSGPPSQ